MKELLEKYFAGNCTPEEIKQVSAWLGTEAGSAELAAMLDAVWAKSSSAPMDPALEEKILQSVRNAPMGRVVAAAPSGREQRKVRHMLPWLAAACTVGIVLGGLQLFHQWQKNAGLKEMNAAAVSAEPVWHPIRNTANHTMKAQLPDGSQVWLTAHSTLQYAMGISSVSRRAIRLDGEAYFDIAPDKTKPMFVEAGSATVEVLGTQFNVECFDKESLLRVALTQGKVAVDLSGTAAAAKQVLAPGQMFTLDKTAGKFTVHSFPAEQEAAWRSGAWVFLDLPLYDALQRVGDRLGYQIVIGEEVKKQMLQQKVTGTFRHEDGPSIFQNLLFVHGYHYKIIGTQLILHS